MNIFAAKWGFPKWPRRFPNAGIGSMHTTHMLWMSQYPGSEPRMRLRSPRGDLENNHTKPFIITMISFWNLIEIWNINWIGAMKYLWNNENCECTNWQFSTVFQTLFSVKTEISICHNDEKFSFRINLLNQCTIWIFEEQIVSIIQKF